MNKKIIKSVVLFSAGILTGHIITKKLFSFAIDTYIEKNRYKSTRSTYYPDYYYIYKSRRRTQDV